MRIDQIDLKIVRLPLVRPFQTSSSRKSHLDHILVRVEAGSVVGWGECASPSDPYYCPETTETCWHILNDFLAPAVLGTHWTTIEELAGFYGAVKGNRFARRVSRWPAGTRWPDRTAFPFMSCWEERGPRSSPGSAWGSSRASRACSSRSTVISRRAIAGSSSRSRRVGMWTSSGGSASGIRTSSSRLTPTRPIPWTTCRPCGRSTTSDLLLIEQPLAHDDIIDHARLQADLKTPICLDESIHSAADARKAIELGACRVINIKVSRVGGLLEAKRVHDVCQARGVPVWCGGMHEFGIGRAANVAIASLPGFTLPGDVSARTSIMPRTSSSRRSSPDGGPSPCSTGRGWASSRSWIASRRGRCAVLTIKDRAPLQS